MRLVERTRAVVARRTVLNTLVVRDLRVRYSNSVLGYVWTILDPLLMSLIYFYVFTKIFVHKDPAHQPYFLFLLCGLLAWQWFSASITDTSQSLVREARLIRSTNLPREVWVVRVVMAKGVEYLFSLPVLVFFVLVYVIRGEVKPDWQLVFFPVAMAVEFVLLIGLGLLLAPITALVNDMNRVIRIIMRMLFYATPVIYTHKLVPPPGDVVLWLNPMTGVLELFRAGFFSEGVSWGAVGVGLAVTLLLLLLGVRQFGRLEAAVLKEI